MVRTVRPKTAALAGIALAATTWFVVLFAGFGGEKASCPEASPAWVGLVVIACAIAATVGMVAAVWAYRETAGEPSRDWLLGAAGLYVTTLFWTATVTGAVSLLLVDVCTV